MVEKTKESKIVQNGLLTMADIHRYARAIPCNKLTYFARVYLKLRDIEIEEANTWSGCLTQQEYITNGIRIWLRRKQAEGNSKPQQGVYEELREILKRAVDEEVIESNPLTAKDWSRGDVHISRRLALKLTSLQWERLRMEHLHIGKHDMEAFLLHREGTPREVAVRILTTWRDKAGVQGTVYNFERHLLEAVHEGILDENVLKLNMSDDTVLSVASLEKHLRTVYLERFSRLCPQWWKEEQDEHYHIDDIYMPLAGEEMCLKDRTCRNRVQRTTALDEIMTLMQQDNKKLVLLEGKPGSGKTWYCKRTCYYWAADSSLTMHNITCVLYADLSTMSPKHTLINHLSLTYLGDPKAEDLMDYILSSSAQATSTLLVLDGFDHLIGAARDDVTALITRKRYVNVNAILTARSSYVPKKLKAMFDVGFTLLDLSTKQVEMFVDKYFQCMQKELVSSNWLPALRIPSTPQYLSLFCMNGDSLNFYGLYDLFVESFIKQSLMRLRPESRAIACHSLLLASYECWKQNSHSFDKSVDGFDENITELGVTSAHYKRRGLSHSECYSFNDSTLVAFLAARYVFSHMSQPDMAQRPMPNGKREQMSEMDCAFAYFMANYLKRKGLMQIYQK